MHEYSIAESLVNLIASQPEVGPRSRVNSAKILVGRLSTVVPSALEFLFGIVPKPDNMKGMKLVVEEVAVHVRCDKCGTEWEPDTPVFICEKCGGSRATILSGQELLLQSIELDDEAPAA
ncbi:MAG: hydrogenase maturation nickel metallochaperone HypA [Planctomycetota bacterium]|nr:hydrogenase maturation nickel metallochaperone HypA [Planctomycetota bacterium]